MMSPTTLTYQVLRGADHRDAGKDIPPGRGRSTWSPISSTLIYGADDASWSTPS